MFAAIMITSSMFISDRAPQSTQYLTVAIAVSMVFVSVGILLFGVQHHLALIAMCAESIESPANNALNRSLFRLAAYLVLGGIGVCLILILINYAILERIDQGFAVFG